MKYWLLSSRLLEKMISYKACPPPCCIIKPMNFIKKHKILFVLFILVITFGIFYLVSPSSFSWCDQNANGGNCSYGIRIALPPPWNCGSYCLEQNNWPFFIPAWCVNAPGGCYAGIKIHRCNFTPWMPGPTAPQTSC